MNLRNTPPGAPRASAQSPELLAGPASAPPLGSSPQSRELRPTEGYRLLGSARLRGRKGVAGPGPPRVASSGPRPAPEGCGRAHVGERRLWGGGGSRAGRWGPAGPPAVKEASRAPGAGAALCVPKLRSPLGPARHEHRGAVLRLGAALQGVVCVSESPSAGLQPQPPRLPVHGQAATDSLFQRLRGSRARQPARHFTLRGAPHH